MEIIIGILIFIFGIIIGSFLNVCIIRIPDKKSIVIHPSSCPRCGTRLTTADLVPVFSYIFLRGKCRHCQHKISLIYPFVELLTGVLFVLLYIKFALGYDLLIYAALTSLLIVISFIDLSSMIIPNGLIIAGFVVSAIKLAAAITTGIFENWTEYIIGFFAGALPLLLIAMFCTYILKKEALGGGDIKLMAFAGLIIGWKLTIVAYIIGIISGALVGILLLSTGKKNRGDEIPFGPFLSAGVIVSVFFGTELINWYVGLL
ncbi:MAG: prepilin peptidase [Christensenellales bacterium]|jgi:leader peptidase (prepilin peptidase)/N-methyltransferase